MAPVKTDDNPTINGDYGNTHLSRLLYYLLSFIFVLGHIVFNISNSFPQKTLLRSMAPRSGGSSTDSHLFIIRYFTMLLLSQRRRGQVVLNSVEPLL